MTFRESRPTGSNSISITSHPTQVNMLCLNSSQAGWHLSLLIPEGWKAEFIILYWY